MNSILKNKIIDRRGSTLVEFLIYIMLLSGFLIILTNIFISIIELKLDSESISFIEQDGRFIMVRLLYDIHRASSITTPAITGNTASNLVLVIGGTDYTYQLNGTDLELTDGSGTARLNSGETIVSGLIFQRIGNPGGKHTVKVQFTVGSVVKRLGGSQTKTFNFTSGLR